MTNQGFHHKRGTGNREGRDQVWGLGGGELVPGEDVRFSFNACPVLPTAQGQVGLDSVPGPARLFSNFYEILPTKSWDAQ